MAGLVELINRFKYKIDPWMKNLDKGKISIAWE